MDPDYEEMLDSVPEDEDSGGEVTDEEEEIIIPNGNN